MKPVFEKIWNLAKPYLDTRKNDIHTEIATKQAFKLLGKEGGDEDIVIPAIILHDVGWKEVQKEILSKSFGPNEKPELNRIHEEEGVKIAKEILLEVNYDKDKTEEILKIIDGHDSRNEAISLNDKIVKDADKLWRFSKEGFSTDCDRFKQTPYERIKDLNMDIGLLFTDSAKEIAVQEIKNRVKESKGAD